MIGNKLYFAKTRPTAKIPTKRDEDGCYDLYCNFDEDRLIIEPFKTVLVSTGIASAFSNEYRVSARERGSSGSIGLKVSSGQLDSGYRGEWFIALYNANSIPITITKGIDKVEINPSFIRYPYDKAVAQFAVEIVPEMNVEEIPHDALRDIKSERGVGKIGSSGK